MAMSDSALLSSGTIPAGQIGLEFKSLISPSWGNYELKLHGVYPQTPFSDPSGVVYPFIFLFMHLSNDNGVTWDTNSCHDANGDEIEGCVGANYSFANMYTIPDGRAVYT